MNIEIKPSNKIALLLSQIERESGRLELAFDKLSQFDFIEKIRVKNIESSLLLDADFTADKRELFLSEFKLISELSSQEIISGNSGRYSSLFFGQIISHANFREIKTGLYGGEDYGILGGLVFETLAPYLIKNRFLEISDWLNQHLLSSQIHPLLVIPCFQLLLLQCSPYRSFNQALSQLFLLILLKENNYQELASSRLTSLIYEDRENYLRTLRQAEKTAGTDWSTLNIYLEFFLEKALNALLELGAELAIRNESAHLTSLQKQIVKVIKEHGALNREAISEELSINPSTIKYNLGVLFEKGQLARKGGGRSTTYSAK